MTLYPVLTHRDYSIRPADTSVLWSVDSFRWNALGGPVEAQLSATATVTGLWSLLDTLRCPVVIYDEKGRSCWWGYVHAVEIQQGGVKFGVTLDEMVNRVSVAYSYVAPGSQTVGTRKTTAVANDADSQGEYGIKEKVISLSGASDEQALQIRDTILARQKFPIPTLEFGAGPEAVASLTCLGWWNTLGWLTYANTDTDSVETTDQVAAMVTAAGQFLAATDLDNASGVSSSEYRDGSLTALAEITDLLKTGTTNGRRLLASVNVDRRLRVYEEAAKPNAPSYYLTSDGTIQTAAGLPVEPHLVGSTVVGEWAALKDVIPATVDVSHFADPSPVFVEEAVWSGGRVTVIPRDNPGYLDLGGIR